MKHETSPTPTETRFFHVDQFGKPLNLSEAEKQASEAKLARYAEYYAEGVQQIESRNEGLNLERVEQFVREMGMKVGQYHVIDPEDVSKVEEIDRHALDKAGLDKLNTPSYGGDNPLGFHIPLSGDTFIVRDKKVEAENGPEATEAYVVHELTHAASEFNDVVIKYDENGQIIDASVPRSGMMVGKVSEWPVSRVAGLYLEEALATYLEGQYRGKFSTLDMHTNEDDFDYSVLSKYKIIHGVRADYSSDYQNVGFALQLMIEAKPELLDALIASRKSVEGLRDTATIIESFRPGFYKSLGLFDPSFDGNDYALDVIEDAIRYNKSAGKPARRAGHIALASPENLEGYVQKGFVSKDARDKTINKLIEEHMDAINQAMER